MMLTFFNKMFKRMFIIKWYVFTLYYIEFYF